VTAQQAKQILLAYRPWTNDAQESEVAEAIALCRRDAALNEWFENHCAFQIIMRGQFRAIPLPEGLKEQIVSEHKSHVPVAWWQRPAILATVAAAVLLIATTSLWFSTPWQPKQDVSFAAYRSRMVRTVIRSYGMDLETNDVGQIRTYLEQHQLPADYVLPKNLERTPTVGCGALSWQGKPVAMVCFRTGKPLPPGAKSDLFLFVIDRKDLTNPPQAEDPVLANVSTMATVTWSIGGKVYLLAGSDPADLKQRL
jgi:hypothetical protein